MSTAPALLIDLTGVARLAGVQRPVASMWRSRFASTVDPFPAPVADGSGRPRFEAENLAANEKLIDALAAMAAAKGVTPAQLALAWVLHRGDGIVPIPGARKIRHLEENAAAAAIVLSADDLAAIDAAMPPEAVSGNRYTEAALALVEG